VLCVGDGDADAVAVGVEVTAGALEPGLALGDVASGRQALKRARVAATDAARVRAFTRPAY
jgi:hypothetical protein